MFLLPTKTDFLEWQIYWYKKRLTEATDQKAISFLKNNLKKLTTCNLLQ